MKSLIRYPLAMPKLKNHLKSFHSVKNFSYQYLNTVYFSKTTINAKETQIGCLGDLIFGRPDEDLYKFCEEGRLKEALDLVFMMDKFGARLDSIMYVSLLKVCGNLRALTQGEIVHAHMILSGIKGKFFWDTKLVVMYVNCRGLEFARQVFDKMPERGVVSETTLIAGYAQSGRIEDARRVFDGMPERNVVSWNAMIAGCGRVGDGWEGLRLFVRMQQWGVTWNHFTFSSVLSICAGIEALECGLQVHGEVIKMGFESGVVVGNALIDMYAKCGNMEEACCVFGKMLDRDVVSWTAMIAGYAQNDRIEDAHKLFDKMLEKNVVSWNAMIAGCAQSSQNEEAVLLFNQMQWEGKRPNQSTSVSVLKACASLGDVKNGKQVHGCIVKMGHESDVHVGSALIDMYAKCSSLDEAREVFDMMPARNLISWSVMVAGYAQHGSMDNAEQLFRKMPERNVVSWNAMISGSAQNGQINAALKLFGQMQCEDIMPDEFTFSSVLSACACSYAIEQGRQLHAYIINNGFDSYLSVGNALVTMYAKNGGLVDACKVFNKMSNQDVVSWTAMITGYAENGRTEEARLLFDKMPERNAVSWNAMITAYLKNGRMEDALQIFCEMPDQNLISWNAMIAVYACEESLGFFFQMHQAGVTPDQSTFTGVLSVCADLAALEKGKQVHSYIIKRECESDVLVSNALITMYGKCGDVVNARQVLDKMQKRDIISWNAMIAGYAQHGNVNEAVELFEQMQQSGMKPNHITFIGVLTACSHGGLVNEGWFYFQSMAQDYHISSRVDHYACMVDLLGRAGYLDEAKNLIKSMPCQPDSVVWGALLGACKIHVNMELGKLAAEHLFELEPQNASAYVALSNVCAMVGRWDEVAKLRILMRDRGVKKNPGCSWIEIKNRVHTFVVGDRSHSQTEKIYSVLGSLHRQMKASGYLPDTNLLAHDLE